MLCFPLQYDFDIHPTYTYFAMERLVEEGLARSIGVSNFNSEQITDIMDRCMIKPAVNQVQCWICFVMWNVYYV